VHDVEGARAAGALSVSVLTGGSTEEELRAAGTDLVLTGLDDFPAWLDAHVLGLRLAALEEDLRARGSVLVAFSGGADSAMLLAAAVRTLGPEQVAAATAYSDSLPLAERDPARAFAESLGVRVLTPRTHEMDREGYRANAGDRCYFCKAELLDVLGPLAAEHGLAHVATGTNADDGVAGFRPGIRAAAERGAITPLLDAGLTKAQVRAASRNWGLPTWDKPAAACLSSRVAYGIEVSSFRLARVERAEAAARAALADAGVVVRDLRVRDLGDRASLEVDEAAVAVARETSAVLAAVRDAGFPEVRVDPRGFRSGSMNERLAEPERYR
jgi:pyridinium-3,5-biscarboxylic acid mononucleotide sulfurtransferase